MTAHVWLLLLLLLLLHTLCHRLRLLLLYRRLLLLLHRLQWFSSLQQSSPARCTKPDLKLHCQFAVCLCVKCSALIGCVQPVVGLEPGPWQAPFRRCNVDALHSCMKQCSSKDRVESWCKNQHASERLEGAQEPNCGSGWKTDCLFECRAALCRAVLCQQPTASLDNSHTPDCATGTHLCVDYSRSYAECRLAVHQNICAAHLVECPGGVNVSQQHHVPSDVVLQILNVLFTIDAAVAAVAVVADAKGGLRVDLHYIVPFHVAKHLVCVTVTTEEHQQSSKRLL